ncbi:MAG TPA: hypothetical protein VII23_07240 [Terriglobales bacterium]
MKMVKCEACGHIQLAKDGGFELDYLNQCIKCGSRNFRDASQAEIAEQKQVDSQRIVVDAANQIAVILGGYFRGDHTGTNSSDEAKLIQIGKSLFAAGGSAAMRAAFRETLDLARREFGYEGSARRLDMIWDGIGQWRG